jgi:hypothetical protein
MSHDEVQALTSKVDSLKESVEIYIRNHAQSQEKMNTFIERAEPYIASWEGATRTGKNVIGAGSLVITAGGAWMVIRNIFLH